MNIKRSMILAVVLACCMGMISCDEETGNGGENCEYLISPTSLTLDQVIEKTIPEYRDAFFIIQMEADVSYVCEVSNSSLTVYYTAYADNCSEDYDFTPWLESTSITPDNPRTTLIMIKNPTASAITSTIQIVLK